MTNSRAFKLNRAHSRARTRMAAATPTVIVVGHRLAGPNGTQPDQSSSAVNYY